MTAQFSEQGKAGEPPIYRVPEMAASPAIDGRIEADEWRDAEQITGLIQDSGALGARSAQVWIGLKGSHVFVAISSELPPAGNLLAKAGEGKQQNTAALFADDVTEFWFSPKIREARSEAPSYRVASNARNSLYTSKHDPEANQEFSVWSCDALIANTQQGGKWMTELRIPLADLGAAPGKLDGLAFRVVRNWKQPAEVAATERRHGTPFSNTATMSQLILDAEAPVVQQRALGDWLNRKMRWEFVLRNPHKSTQRLQVNLSVASTSSMPPKVLDQIVELKPGQELPILLEADLFPDVVCDVEMKISSAEGDKAYFHRAFHFETKPRPPLWQLLSVPSQQEISCFIAYSPSSSKLGLKISGLKPSQSPAAMRGVVRRIGADEPLVSQDFPSPIRSGDGTSVYGLIDLPLLPEGQYEAQCILILPDGEKSFRQPFSRTVYPWENNSLGRGDSLPAGFLPLSFDESRWSTGLGSVTFGRTGLPSEMRAEQVALLSGPMLLKAKMNGRRLSAEGQGFIPVKTAGKMASGSALWKIGLLRGKTEMNMDYDGFLLCTLTLDPGQAEVESLDLEIPLANEEVSLMHNVGAGIRGNYAGKVPSGEGLIWSNFNAVAYGYPDNFIPYLWLGGTRRGLAWCADSSTNWQIGAKQPALELWRTGGTLTLKLRLISEKTTLDCGRKITFGLQLTPVKNRPKNWRRIDFVERFPEVETVRILGSCPYWGGISAFGDFYPRNKDFSILEQLYQATQTKEVTSEMKSFIAEWNEGNAGLTNAEGINRHVELGFTKAAASDYLIPYTDAREIRQSTPEFQVFQDEWVRKGFNPRTWSKGNTECTSTEAVPSFQDFALWNFEKMKDVRFAKGIYFDNDFPIARNNPFWEYEVAAYPGLELKPPTGLLEVREYFRRAYEMFSEDGEFPLNTVHMTNSALALHLAFASISLDWEMKYGAADFQDRFSQDYIFASTMGEQFGTIPLVLSGIFPSKEKSVEWLTRSLIGTTFIYELKIFASSQLDFPTYKQVFDIIYGFGYGKEDCQVHRYWEHPPFEISGGDQRAILLKRKQRLLLMVADFGDGGTARVNLKSGLLPGGGEWKALNAETAEPLDFDGKTLVVPLQKHQFKLIEISSSDHP